MSMLISPPAAGPADVSDIQLLYNIFLALTGGVPGSPVIPTFGGGGSFSSTFLTATTGGNIPTNVKKYSFAVLSGVVTLGGQSVPVGATINGGGYGQTSAAAIPYTISGGSVLIQYEN